MQQRTSIHAKHISLLQDNFCDVVSFDCPTQDDFDSYDSNGDEVVTWLGKNILLNLLSNIKTRARNKCYVKH